jgi:hypothetical protein
VTGSFPGQATYFLTYETMQSLQNDHGNRFGKAFLSGLMAEMTSALFYVPTDIISQRLQVQDLKGFHHNQR